MITTLIFDVYGTIIAYEHGKNAGIVIDSMREAGIDPPKDELNRLWGEYYRAAELEDEFRTEAQIFEDRVAWLYERYGCTADPSEAYRKTAEVSKLRVAFPEAKAAIDRLRKSYRVVIGSNTDDGPMFAHLEKSGIEADAYYTSEDLRCYKPSPEFYRKILEAEGIEPEQALFVGDSVQEDVRAPKDLGMHAVWVNRRKPHAEYGQDFTVSSLAEIEEKLKTMDTGQP